MIFAFPSMVTGSSAVSFADSSTPGRLSCTGSAGQTECPTCRRDARFGSPHRLRRQGVFRPMSNDHVSTWIASVYTVHVIMFLRDSASVYIVHVVNISIGNYFAKPRRSCFEFRAFSLHVMFKLYKKKYVSLGKS